MAPASAKSTRGSKRSRSTPKQAKEEATPSAKAKKLNPKLVGVLEGLAMVDLSEDCRTMLTSMAPMSIGVKPHLRDPSQVLVVEMIGEALELARATKERAIAEEAENIVAIGNSGSERERKVPEEEARLAAAADAVTTHKAKLVEATEAFQVAKKAFEGVQAEYDGGEAAAAATRTEWEALSAAFEGDFRALKEESLKADETKRRIKALMPVAQSLGLEEGHRAALSGSFAMKPAERSPFDETVIEMLETKLKEKLATFTKELVTADLAKTDRSAKLEVARQVFAKEKESMQGFACSFSGAQKAHGDAEAALAHARKAVTSVEADVAAAKVRHEEKQEELGRFVEHHVRCFESLKEEVSQKPSAEMAVDKEE